MKLNGYNIIIFGLPRLDSEIESTNYTTARHLANNNKVYYVENPYTLKDYFRLKGTTQHERRKNYFSLFGTKIIETTTPDLYVVVPPVVFSINFLPEGKLFRLALKLNEFLLAFKIKRIIEKYDIRKFIFINSFNFHYPTLASFINPLLQVYHCLDPLVLPFDRKHGNLSESMLIKNSDIVVCSSRQLYNENIGINAETYFVPNAADLSHSSKALNPALAIDGILSGFHSPVVGYFGAIERRIDYVMLKEVIEKNNNMTFVFVGPVSDEFIPDWFRVLPNVKFTGPVPYNQMPAVIKGFEVALIPFKKDEFSRTIFPLKLFEYLGAGKPVVCTDFNPDLAEFTEDTVSYCSDAAAFSDAINSALNDNTTQKRDLRIAVAAANTWERRIDEIEDIIIKGLEKKSEVKVLQS